MNVLEWTQDKLETLEYIANTWIHDMGNVLDIHFPSIILGWDQSIFQFLFRTI
jgi:hypothetical protein